MLFRGEVEVAAGEETNPLGLILAVDFGDGRYGEYCILLAAELATPPSYCG